MPKDDKWHKLNFKENQNKGTFKQQKQKRRKKMSEEEKKRSMKNNRIRERMTIKIMMEGKDLENRKKY